MRSPKVYARDGTRCRETAAKSGMLYVVAERRRAGCRIRSSLTGVWLHFQLLETGKSRFRCRYVKSRGVPQHPIGKKL